MTNRLFCLRRLTLSTAILLALALPGHSQDAVKPTEPLTENAGSYLAARVASGHSDFTAAAEWYSKALVSAPDDPILLQGLIVAQIGLGDFEAATLAARAFLKSGISNPSVGLTLITGRAATQDYAGVLDELRQGQSAGPTLDNLIKGWAEMGQGHMTEALALFEDVSKASGFEPMGLYQQALAMASAGDLEGAEKILSGPAAGSIATFRRGVVAHLQILSQLERNADALKLFDASFTGALDPDLLDLRRRLEAGEPMVFDLVTTPKEGIAETLYTFASAISGQAEPQLVLAYARAALYLRPEQTEMKLLVAALLNDVQQYALAAEAFALVDVADPAFHAAEIGRADALKAAGDTEGAIAVLKDLAKSHGQIVQVQLALGDALRRAERYDEALVAYDAGIALISGPAPWSWPLHYNRAICLERLGRFAEAEPGFRKALELAPNQPQVLNYLGYTFIDRGENLDEALGMIKAAVAAAPDQGYIIDSLAWAFYRLGRFAEALEPMERASLLEPVDPIVTDHLGDVYWVNGRKLEAQFQWQRALSFEPTEKDAERIRAKLKMGLDLVLEREKAGN